MSNYTAIATATAVLSYLLDRELQRNQIDNVQLTFLPPNLLPKQDKNPGINIFLFEVGPNMAWRNQELPMRASSGALVQRPQTAIDLHYLLSFYGQYEHLTGQLLLALAMSALNTNAVLEPPLIEAAIKNPYKEEWKAFLKLSNLMYQPDLVKFHQVDLDLGELSNLWAIFHHTEYNLSVVYHASVVLIDAEVLPAAALPVTGVDNRVSGAGLPAILEGSPSRAAPDDVLRVEYTSTAGLPSQLLFNGVAVGVVKASPGALRRGAATPIPIEMDNQQILIPLDKALIDAAALESGAVHLQLGFGGSPALVSAPWRFDFVPALDRLKSPTVSLGPPATLLASMRVKVQPSQTVLALLVPLPPEAGGEGRGVSRSIPWNIPPEPTHDISFPLAETVQDLYLVQISIDGLASPLEKQDGYFSRPRVEIPTTR